MDLRALVKEVLPPVLLDALRAWRSRIGMRRIGVGALRPRDDVAYLGTVYGGYAVPTELVRGTTGLSFGAGEDISFETAMARDLGATVHLFDPTPRAIEYCERMIDELGPQASGGHLSFHAFGAWSESKTLRFYSPANPTHVSHSIINMQRTQAYFEARCLSPKDILQRLDLDCVGFVKLNIEGAEYEVIDAMFDARILPPVVCITFDELHTPADKGAAGRMSALVRRFDEESYRPVDLSLIYISEPTDS
jgi:FkbM family methyltransferase